jgi:hypothetical protein
MKILSRWIFFISVSFVAFANAQNYSWQKLNTENTKANKMIFSSSIKMKDGMLTVLENIPHYEWRRKLGNDNRKEGNFFRCITFRFQKGFVGNLGTDYFPNVNDSIPCTKPLMAEKLDACNLQV